MFFYKTEKLLIVNLIHDLNFTISDYTCNKQTFNVYTYYIQCIDYLEEYACRL